MEGSRALSSMAVSACNCLRASTFAWRSSQRPINVSTVPNCYYFNQTLLVVDPVEDPIAANSDSVKIQGLELDGPSGSGFGPQAYNVAVNPAEYLIGEGFEFLSGRRLDENSVVHNRPVFFRSARTRS